MGRESIRVTASDGFQTRELKIKTAKGIVRLKLSYDWEGVLSEIDILSNTAGIDVKDVLPLFLPNIPSVGTIQKQPRIFEAAWNQWLADGNFVEAWSDVDENGERFRRGQYHGRMGAYFADEVGFPYEKWTLPEIVINDNPYEEQPWRNAIRMRNENPRKPGQRTALYVGFPKAHHNVVMSFWANLAPVAAANDEHYIGFEVTSGGSFGIITALCQFGGAGAYYLRALNYSGLRDVAVTIRHPGVYAKYALVKKQDVDEATSVLLLYQAPVASPDGFPLEMTHSVDLGTGAAPLPTAPVMGKTMPFMANENKTGISEFRVNRIWIYDLGGYDDQRSRTH